MEKGKSRLLRLVEEKARLMEAIDKEKRKLTTIPYLPRDCISNILFRLSIESLPQLKYICKTWYTIINNPSFVDAHLISSKTVLIFLSVVGRDVSVRRSNVSPIESKLFQPNCPYGLRNSLFDPLCLYSINFMEIMNQKGIVTKYNETCLENIRASCNGILLLDSKIKKGGLIVMNPVTREVTDLPVGTVSPTGYESYGLTFCSHANDYKVVHLFQDELRYVGCEILDLSTRRWRGVNGPPFGFFNFFSCNPVFANEVLYWLPPVTPNNYLISFTLDDEKFQRLPLPKSCTSRDSIFQMAGQLGLITHEEPYQIVLWVLSNSRSGNWKKRYTMTVDCRYVIPQYFRQETDEFIFIDGYNKSVYSYDVYLHYSKKIEVKNGPPAIHGHYVPHVNSLLSWKTQGKDQFMDH